MITNRDISVLHFQEYRKLGVTKISDEVMSVGTQVEVLGSVYTCNESSRIAIDAAGNVYPIAVSIFEKAFEKS